MKEPISMSMTCTYCGSRVHNDDPELGHPLEFLDALRARGWFIPDTGPATSQQVRRPHACPSCVVKGK